MISEFAFAMYALDRHGSLDANGKFVKCMSKISMWFVTPIFALIITFASALEFAKPVEYVYIVDTTPIAEVYKPELLAPSKETDSLGKKGLYTQTIKLEVWGGFLYRYEVNTVLIWDDEIFN